MSSVQDQIKCPQCKYPEADYVYYCRIGEDLTICRRCGYHESWTAKRSPEGIPCGWVHEIDEGFGALWYTLKGAAVFSSVCLRSAEGLAEAEAWLRERLAKDEVESKNSYLTRWNKESRKIEVVIGEFNKWDEVCESPAKATKTEGGRELSKEGNVVLIRS